MRLPACQFVFSVQPLTSSRVLGVRESVSTGKYDDKSFYRGKGKRPYAASFNRETVYGFGVT